MRLVAAALAWGSLLGGCGAADADQVDDGASSARPSASGVAPAEVATPPQPRPEPGRVRVPGGVVVGVWEDGEPLGEHLDLGLVDGRPEILYAARPPDPANGGREAAEGTYVATGVREGSRILRTIVALTPERESAPDGIDLYGGNALGDRGPDESVEDGSYLIAGSAPGDVEVTVAGPDGRPRPVTGSSTQMLPGYTVFYDKGPWGEDWDQVRLAPLTVTTSDGHRVDVRARSWVG